MVRRAMNTTLCLMLALAVPSLAVSADAGPSAKLANSPLTAPASPSAFPQEQQPTSVRPNSTAPQRAYASQAHPRRRHITKGEIFFMAGIAGTSMGIGAIVAGGTGLAIGAIAGGWGAYVGHRLWHRINR